MNLTPAVIYAWLASFALTFLCILLLKPVAYKIQLLDVPGGRKQHLLPTPVIGGIAMLLGAFAALLLLPISLLPFRGLIFGSALLVFVGVLDDIHELSPRGRLIAQLIVLCVMIFWSNIQLHHLGNLTGNSPIILGWFAIPLTLFGAASLINAVNMLDGLDGLSGSIVLIALTSLAFIAYFSGYNPPLLVMGVFIAALVAYLYFNFPLPGRAQAVCFMGDAGSMLLGFVLAWFTISLSQLPNTLAGPAIMLWVAGIPLLDLATVFIKRLLDKRSPFDAGRDHIHHVLQDWGFSPRMSLLLIILAMLACNAVAWGMIIYQVADVWALIGFLILFALYFFIHPKRQVINI